MPVGGYPISKIGIESQDGLDPRILGTSDEIEFINMMINLYLDIAPGNVLRGSQPHQVLMER
jgi:hypothetical protein